MHLSIHCCIDDFKNYIWWRMICRFSLFTVALFISVLKQAKILSWSCEVYCMFGVHTKQGTSDRQTHWGVYRVALQQKTALALFLLRHMAIYHKLIQMHYISEKTIFTYHWNIKQFILQLPMSLIFSWAPLCNNETL